MGKTTLVGPGIQEGQEFLDLLHRAGVTIKAAVWQRDDVRLRWTLDLFTPIVDEIGLKDSFRKLRDTLNASADPPAVDLLDVYLYSPKVEICKRLRRQFGRASDKYVQNVYLGDHLMKEGYIYFIK
ncbi:MAG: hypothetical protein JNL62_23925 [Bryobacterales bacterium]|nr:hypothetical protein [Bryobacterales bacterium]